MSQNDEHASLMRQLSALEKENNALHQKLAQYEKGEQRYRHLYENAPVGMYEVDFVSGRCVSVNRFVLQYTGYTQEEFLAMDPVDFLTEASREHFFERFEKIQRGEEVPTSVEFQIKIKDGRTLWALFEIQYIRKEGRIMGASVVLYNIDERKRALMALAESEQRFRRLVETMNEGLIILDNEGRLTYVNKHLEEISGFSTEELVGRKIQEFLSPEASRYVYQRITGQDKNPRRSFEMTWKRKSGEQKYSIISPQVLPGAEDGASGSFAIITDITAKKKAENAVRRREKELQNKNAQLEEMNTALRTLVNLREHDKSEIENRISANLQQLVAPLVEKLQSSGLNDRQKIYTKLLSAYLDEITSSFNQIPPPHLLVLTPAEIEVANLVKHGRSTKEIASLVNISARTVDMHRLNIRRKLGLHKKGTNLRSFLLST
jgi:PAS domain S-box-containing protein